MNIILASKSPRRSELLSQIGLKFSVMVSDADENINEVDPAAMVEKLSYIKAKAVYDSVEDIGVSENGFENNREAIKENSEDIAIIGADTVVTIDGKILGKPKDDVDAYNMLKMLSGESHKVMTGVSLLKKAGGKLKSVTFHEETIVNFEEMTDAEINEYILTKEPADKAGGYGIQGIGAKFITSISGDYNNVVGLPLAAIYKRLKEF